VYQAFKTKDGFIVVVADLDAHFRKLCTALKLTDFLEDPSLATLRQRKERKPVVVERLTKIFLTDTVAAWKKLLIDNGVPCSPINSVGDILDDPHLRDEGLGQIVSQPGAAGKAFLSIGCPVRINEVRPIAKRPPPKMGEDQERYFGGK
jgi:CoA:oxalate CoA-transferase